MSLVDHAMAEIGPGMLLYNGKTIFFGADNVSGKGKTAIYTLCGTFAGLGGVMMASRLSSAQPSLGAGYELDAIAAVVIGGTSLSGGSGTILGTIIGAFIMSVLTNGLRIMSVAQEWQIVVTGVIVVVAVYLDIVRRRSQEHA